MLASKRRLQTSIWGIAAPALLAASRPANQCLLHDCVDGINRDPAETAGNLEPHPRFFPGTFNQQWIAARALQATICSRAQAEIMSAEILWGRIDCLDEPQLTLLT